MGDHKEVLYERLYVKVPGTDKLRKTAAARLKHLLANGYREIDRTQAPDSIVVHVERTGVAPLKARLPARKRRTSATSGGRADRISEVAEAEADAAKLDRTTSERKERGPPKRALSVFARGPRAYRVRRTFAAWGPFSPEVTSNSTVWPSSRLR